MIRTLPPPPRALLVLAGVVLVVGVGVSAVGGWRTGVSWDETYHVMRLHDYLHSGWYVLDGELAGGPGGGAHPGPWVGDQYVYGPVSMLLLHAWSLLWGVDTPGQVSLSARAFEVRHLGVTLMSLLGVAATAGLARLGLRSWGWGLVAAASLVAVPTWTGHAMFNVKDVPVASGYTLVSLGVVVVAQAGRARWTAAGVAVTLAGLLLAMGTRPGIWPGLGLAGLVAVVVVLARRQWVRAALLVGTALAAVAALALIYPAAFGDPLHLVQAATQSDRFDGQSGTWSYVPRHLLIELPTLLLLLGAVGTVVAVRRLRWARLRPDTPTLAVTVVLLQALALPGIAVVRQSNIYSGLRQLLFATPGLAVLVTCALAVLWARRTEPDARAVATRRRTWAVPALTAVALLAPVSVQLQLFPYGYASSSAAANVAAQVFPGLVGSAGQYQSDYWRTSVRELAPAVPTTGFVVCSPVVDGDTFLPRGDGYVDDCAHDPVGPLLPYAATRTATWADPPSRFLAVVSSTRQVGRGCTVLHRVTRPMLWRTVTMSYVAACDLVLPDYPVTGITVDGDGTGKDFLMGDWLTRYDVRGASLPGGSGAVGLTLPATLVGRDLTVTGSTLVGGAGREGVTAVSVDGRALAVRRTAAGFSVPVPAAAASALGEGRLVLHLTAAPDVHLTGLRVTGARRLIVVGARS